MGRGIRGEMLGTVEEAGGGLGRKLVRDVGC